MSLQIAARFIGAGGFKLDRRLWSSVGEPVCRRAQILLLPKNALA